MRLTIQGKIALLVSVTILVLLIITTMLNYQGQTNTLESFSHERAQSFNKVFWDKMDSDAAALEKLLSVLTKNTALVEAFSKP